MGIPEPRIQRSSHSPPVIPTQAHFKDFVFRIPQSLPPRSFLSCISWFPIRSSAFPVLPSAPPRLCVNIPVFRISHSLIPPRASVLKFAFPKTPTPNLVSPQHIFIPACIRFCVLCALCGQIYPAPEPRTPDPEPRAFQSATCPGVALRSRVCHLPFAISHSPLTYPALPPILPLSRGDTV